MPSRFLILFMRGNGLDLFSSLSAATVLSPLESPLVSAAHRWEERLDGNLELCANALQDWLTINCQRVVSNPSPQRDIDGPASHHHHFAPKSRQMHWSSGEDSG
jgi:hypothetical protein